MSQNQNNSTVFKYNGQEKEFDIADVECNKKFEGAVKALQEECNSIPKTGLASDMMKSQVDIIKRFFDNLFGDGAGVELCGEKDNFNSCFDAYEAILSHINEQKERIVNRKLVVGSAQQPNRAARRSK